jgi:hypothetical protein
VVLANPDLNRILTSVRSRTTPVVIAERLQWVPKASLDIEKSNFTQTLMTWRATKVQADTAKLMAFYTQDFSNYGKNLAQYLALQTNELSKLKGRDIALTNLSLMRWTDKNDTMVVTFDEVIAGSTRGVTKRQYWMLDGKNWKIFFEGVI